MSKRTADEQSDVQINLPGTTPAPSDAADLDQIRTLLFGEPIQQIMARIDQVESEATRAIQDIVTTVETRFAQLEDRLVSEVDARASAHAEMKQLISDESKASADAQIDLRTSIDRRAAEFRQQLGAARADLQSQIGTVDADLREKNVDRNALAGLFEQVATQLHLIEE